MHKIFFKSYCCFIWVIAKGLKQLRQALCAYLHQCLRYPHIYSITNERRSKACLVLVFNKERLSTCGFELIRKNYFFKVFAVSLIKIVRRSLIKIAQIGRAHV